MPLQHTIYSQQLFRLFSSRLPVQTLVAVAVASPRPRQTLRRYSSLLCNAGSPQTALTPALIHTPDTNCSFSHYTPKSTNRNHTKCFSRLPHASNDQI
jgi:hypothetical protein